MKSYDELILKMAKMLVGRQVEQETVNKALDLVCENFSFDSVLIYEADQLNDLKLKEHCLKHEVALQDKFVFNVVFPEDSKMFVENTIIFINQKAENSRFEKELLKTFSSAALVVFPFVDEENRINGLVVCTNVMPRKKILDADISALNLLLSMLGGYLRVRIFKNKLAFVQSSLTNILNNAGIDIYVNDFLTHEILYVNASMAAPYGGVSQFIGNTCWEVLFPEQNGPCEFCPQKEIVDENGEPTRVYSWDYQRPFDGSWFRVFSAAFRWMDGRLAHVVSSADITENKQNEKLIQYMANYDELTNLPNRRMLVSECERRIQNVTEKENVYVLFFDIDRFKEINDNFGHEAGDEFLIKMGEFFSSIPMLKKSVYRNGGDEFVAVIGSESLSKSNVRSLVGFIHERFKKPWLLKSGAVFCNISVGVACYPEDGLTTDQLLYKSDQAMYKVKKAGGGSVMFGYEL